MIIQYPDVKKDLNNMVAIHKKSFPNFFLTLMGIDFIKEYYLTVLEYPEHICFVAKEGDRLIGLAAGFGKPRDFYAYYRSKKKKFIPKILQSLIKRPRLLPYVVRNLKRIKVVQSSDLEVELSSICIMPESAGTGTGKKLLISFVNEAINKGFETVYLTTDKHENDKVNNFYLKQGFNLEKSFFQGKREMNFFRLNLKTALTKPP